MNDKLNDKDTDLEFIWGHKSYYDISKSEPNLYTINDIDIVYDKATNLYMLGIETSYVFKNTNAECEYLTEILMLFTKFMDDNNYSKDLKFDLIFNQPELKLTSDSIEKLYTNFKIFVLGFCNLYKDNK